MKGLSLGLAVAIVLIGGTIASAQKRTTEPSTIILDQPEVRASADTGLWPTLGDTVTFSATYPKQLESKGVRVQILCYQDGALVYGMAGSHDSAFQLGGGMSQWLLNGGDANCVATLYYWSYNGGQKFNWLAETHFDAGY